MTKKINEKDLIKSLRKTSKNAMPEKNFKKDLLKKISKKLDKERVKKPSVFNSLTAVFKNYRLAFAGVSVILILAILTGFVGKDINKGDSDGDDKIGLVNDWQYSPADYELEESISGSYNYKNTNPSMVADESLGFSTGGAKDINNFRENIENGYFPLTSDITYEGLFYDYYFDTGKTEECEELFCPSYSLAVSDDPFSGEEEYYMTVGLNSGIKESDFERKKLNLVVVLDISGSMSSGFNSYYYDDDSSDEESKSKMETARESVAEMTKHLEKDDSFGMVLFDDSASLAKPLSKVGETDMDAIRKEILNINDDGGTNMESGFDKGTDLFDELKNKDPDEYENRIIFLTDAMPNMGNTSENGLKNMIEENSDDGIYTSFIGIGVDFNTELIEVLTKVEGANYYSVHSSKDFKKRLDDEFDFMVTPLVFDLKLEFESEDFEIEKVYGSPEADEASGELMKVNTLFPSSSEGGETKGGVVLLKLKPKDDISTRATYLNVSYKDRSGKKFTNGEKIGFAGILKQVQDDNSGEYFENSGIQKAVLLTRYANLIKNWIYEERQEIEPNPIIFYDECMKCTQPYPIPSYFSEWERTSIDLTVSENTKKALEEFKQYFEDQAEQISDDDLEKEVEILDELIG